MAAAVAAAGMAAAEEEEAVAVELRLWLATGLAPRVSTSTGISATLVTNVGSRNRRSWATELDWAAASWSARIA
jgi:hypothetical protein